MHIQKGSTTPEEDNPILRELFNKVSIVFKKFCLDLLEYQIINIEVDSIEMYGENTVSPLNYFNHWNNENIQWNFSTENRPINILQIKVPKISNSFQDKYKKDKTFRGKLKAELGESFFEKAKPLLWETSFKFGDDEYDIIYKFLDAYLSLRIYEDFRKYKPKKETEADKDERAYRRFSRLIRNPIEINRRIYPLAINPLIDYNGFVTKIEVDTLMSIRAVNIYDQIYLRKNVNKHDIYFFAKTPYLLDCNKDCSYLNDFLHFTSFYFGKQIYRNCPFEMNLLQNPLMGGSGRFEDVFEVRIGLNDMIKALYLWKQFRKLEGMKIYNDILHFLKNAADAIKGNSPEKEIADLITSWEFIALGSNNQELSEKFTQFMTALSDKTLSENKQKVYELIKVAYKIRSAINHGDTPKKKYKITGMEYELHRIREMIKDIHLSIFENILILANLNRYKSLDELRVEVKRRIITGLNT